MLHNDRPLELQPRELNLTQTFESTEGPEFREENLQLIGAFLTDDFDDDFMDEELAVVA